MKDVLVDHVHDSRSLLVQCRLDMVRQEEQQGYPVSVLYLCHTHNTEIAREVAEKTGRSIPKLTTLFSVPVVDGTKNGMTQCLLCK